MSILFWIVVGIIVLAAYIGRKKGLVKIAASLVSTVISIVLVMLLSPIVSNLILEYTPLEKVVTKQCSEMLADEDTQDALLEGLSRDEEFAMIENSGMPTIFQEVLKENNNDEAYEALGEKTFGGYVGAYVAKLIADIIAFLITFLIVKLILRIFIGVFGIIDKIPFIGGANRIAGGVIGAGIGLVFVWILFIVITLLYSTSLGHAWLEDINSSAILSWLYSINPLMGMLGL